jgi:hypothetical protein
MPLYEHLKTYLRDERSFGFPLTLLNQLSLERMSNISRRYEHPLTNLPFNAVRLNNAMCHEFTFKRDYYPTASG